MKIVAEKDSLLTVEQSKSQKLREKIRKINEKYSKYKQETEKAQKVDSDRIAELLKAKAVLEKRVARLENEL